jgi:hypothetical protein
VQDKANTWKQRFDTCENQQAQVFTRVSKYYDILYAVQNTTDMAPWRSKVYIPILAGKAWDLISRLSNVEPYFQTKIDEVELDEEGYKVPQDVIDRQNRLDAKLAYDYNNHPDEPMKLKVSDTLIDAVVAGTGWSKISWEVKKDKQYNKQIDDEGMVKNPDKDESTEYEYGCNNFEPLNFFNVFVAPNSPSWARAPYIIVRHYKPFTELENDPKYDVKKLDGSPAIGQFDIYNQARNRVVNNTNSQDRDSTVDTATIYECYERKSDGVYLTTYAQTKSGKSWYEVRSKAKRYWHKYYPIVPFYIRKKTFSPWGESLFENNATLQSATNDIFNHYSDNLNVSLDSMIMYEDGTLTNDFVVEPGGEITYTGDVPKQFKFPEPNPAQITMVMNQLQGAIEAATVPQYISGVPNSSTDKTAGTAKGISLITEAATEKIGFMRDNFKQSMVTVGKIWLSNLAQFQDKPQVVEYPKDGVNKPDIVMPKDYQGPINLTIDDDSLLPLTKDERRDIALGFNIQLGQVQKMAIEAAQFFQDPTLVPKINWSSRIEEIAKYFSVKDANRIMSKATASPMGLMGGMDGGIGQTVANAAAQGQEGAQNGFQSQVGQ